MSKKFITFIQYFTLISQFMIWWITGLNKSSPPLKLQNSKKIQIPIGIVADGKITWTITTHNF